MGSGGQGGDTNSGRVPGNPEQDAGVASRRYLGDGPPPPSTLLATQAGERGAGLVEYILVIVLLSVAVTGSMKFFSGCMGSKFTQAGSAVETGTVS
jgi:Flp pilus assembly pilin Flp